MNTHINKHQHYAANTAGRDFITGDLHGCIEDLNEALGLVIFNPSVDRLFSCGDLIDRGPNSFKTAHLIYNDWFHSIKGNHEQFAIDTFINKNSNMAACWLQNGGVWIADYDDYELVSLAESFQKLPLMISVGEGEYRFNIVHAELTHRPVVDGHRTPVPVTNQMIDDWVFTEYDEEDMIWGRNLITTAKALNSDMGRRFHDSTLSTTYVGHSQVRQPVIIEKQVYIDTSAVNHHLYTNKSMENCLTLAEPNRKVLHKFGMVSRTIETIELDCLLKYGQ